MFMKQLLLIVIKGKFQVKYYNVTHFPSTSWIQTKQGFKKVFRIFAFVLRFIKKLQKKSRICQIIIVQKTSYPGILSDEEISASDFISERWYSVLQRKDTSNRKDKCNFWNINHKKYICSNTFFVPVIYKYSLLAYSIANKIHWHSDASKHSGVENIWRYVLKLGYIMHSGDLVWRRIVKDADNLEKNQSKLKWVQFQLTL